MDSLSLRFPKASWTVREEGRAIEGAVVLRDHTGSHLDGAELGREREVYALDELERDSISPELCGSYRAAMGTKWVASQATHAGSSGVRQR